ncbi:MAG: hypothetical protein ACM34H_08760 [Deltaproteobacteria bacterium]
MKKSILTSLAVVVALAVLPSVSPAQHQHGAAKGEPMKMDTKEVMVEGVKVVFQIMANEEHKKMLLDMKSKEEPEAGTTHNIAVTLTDEKTHKEVTNAEVNMKVIDPAGKSQIKPLKADTMMKYYNAYFNLSQKGKYEVLIVFKVGDRKSNAGIYYDVK